MPPGSKPREDHRTSRRDRSGGCVSGLDGSLFLRYPNQHSLGEWPPRDVGSITRLSNLKHKTFTWETIRDEVRRTTNSPISKLIDYVLASEFSDYLFPATIHSNLSIGRSKDFSRADGELTIEFNHETDSVIFSYYDADNAKPWKKTCASAEAVTTFQHILTKRLRWIKVRKGVKHGEPPIA
jgi:hypothetical protein